MSRSSRLRRAVEASADRTVDIGTLASLIADADPTLFVEACIDNRLSGIVADRLIETGVLSDEQLAPLLHERNHAGFRHLRTVRALGDVLDGMSMDVLVVKGPVLASHWYTDGYVRGYGDLDLLVRREDFQAAVDDLERMGFRLVTENWRHYTDAGMGELQFALGGVKVDLHWDLQPVRAIRHEIPLAASEWFERSITVDIGGRQVRTLGVEDTLLHLALHGALSGGNSVVFLTDLRAVIDHGIDWATFAELVDAAGGPGCVHGLLDRARRTISVDVPDAVIDGLHTPRLWRPIFRAVEDVPRSMAGMGRALRPRRLLMSGRSSWPATLRQLGSISLASAASRVGIAPRYSPGGSRHYLTPSGGSAGRREYLAYVASSAA